MTQEHPITPPPELLKHWEDQHFDEGENYDAMLIQAYQVGADHELEACCEWIKDNCYSISVTDHLRSARRPKPPSLKEQALEILEINNDVDSQLNAAHYNILRLALQSLPD